MLLSRMLRPLIRIGELTVVDARGRRHVFSGRSGPAVTIRLHDPALHRQLFTNPTFHAGEAYMDGRLTMEEGTIHDFLDLVGRNLAAADRDLLGGTLARSGVLLRRLQQFNPVIRSQRNAAHHYDLSDQLYECFLDRDKQYSCAYFRSPSDSLEQAQEQKKRHIAAKLLLQRGHKVLDIGCGWGGLALYLARTFDIRVKGITLAHEQIRVCRDRAQREELGGRASFALEDYRHQTDQFDRIVSVGMFEHVGVTHYRAFFRTLRERLADGGVALLHTIGRTDGPGATNPWLRKYIFPGGYSPALSEVVRAIERERLIITDVEVLRLHYAETLRHWRERFLANRERVRALYDERFCRMWEFYLAACEMNFRHLDSVVFQIQLAKDLRSVPLMRDYMVDTERRLEADAATRGERAA